MTDAVSDPEDPLEIGIFDVSRVHFMPNADIELYTEHLDEATAPRESDVVVACTCSEMQAIIGCKTNRVFSSLKCAQTARPILRCSSTNSENREVQFVETTSVFLQTGLQSITSAQC